MSDETLVSEVLGCKIPVEKLNDHDFQRLPRILGRMFLCRVLNCLDGSGKWDKEWSALSAIFSRIADNQLERKNNMTNNREDAE